MAAAYVEADGGHLHSRELQALGYIDRFGVQAVYGRALSYGEIRRLVAAENIMHWYHERQAASDWAAWARQNGHKAATLFMAQRAASELGWMDVSND